MPYCPSCGEKTGRDAASCPACGSPLDSGTRFSSLGSDVLLGVLAGFLAFVAGFAAMALLSDARENAELVENLVDATGPVGISVSQFLPEWYELLSWVFLANHHVDVSATVGDELGTGAFVADYTETVLPTASELQLLPPLLLTGAGFLVASHRSRSTLLDAVRAGGTVVLGYLPGILLVLSVATFQVVFPVGDVVLLEISPDFGRAIVIAGLGYPLVFGGFGGLLAFAIDRN